MRARILATACLLSLIAAPAPTSADAPPATVDELVRARVLADLGGLPESALVDDGTGARVVPFEDALALLRDPSFRLPAGEADDVVPPTQDAAVGARGNGPCGVGALVTAYARGRVEALVFDTPLVNVPDGSACGFGSFVGDASATRGAAADYVLACVASGAPGPSGWLSGQREACHANDFSRAGVYGRVSQVHIQFCFFNWCSTIDQLIAYGKGIPVGAGAGPWSITLE